MKSFFSHIRSSAGFILLLAAGIAAVNIVYHQRVLSKYIMVRTDRQFQASASQIEILFMGDSHIQHGLSTLEIENSFNFASRAEHYILSYYKLKTILKGSKVKPRALIMPMDLHSFATRTLQAHYFNDPWYWRKYVNFFEAAYRLRDITVAAKFVDAFFPFMGNGLDFFSPIRSDELTPTRKGFVQNYNRFSDRRDRSETAAARALGQLQNTNRFDPHLVFYFKRILELADEFNIPVLLVKMPVSKLYFNNAVKCFPDIGVYKKNISEILSPYKHAAIVDYQHLFFTNDYYFWDCDHLNDTGAQVLSLHVWKDALGLMASVNPESNFKWKIVQIEKKLAVLTGALADADRHVKESGLIRQLADAGKMQHALERATKFMELGNRQLPLLSFLLENSFKKRNEALRTSLVRVLKTADIPGKVVFDGGGMITFGLTEDYWTTDGKPAYLVVDTLDHRGPAPGQIWLACHAEAAVFPLTVTVTNGKRMVRHVFKQAGRIRITLPETSSGESTLFMVTADKTWVPPGGKDQRILGVRVVFDETGQQLRGKKRDIL